MDVELADATGSRWPSCAILDAEVVSPTVHPHHGGPGMNAALPVQSGAPARRAVTSARWPLPFLTQRRQVLAFAALFGLVCHFFAAVAVTGRRESPLGAFSAMVFLTIRLLGAGVGLQKLRRASFNPRLPAHWMLLAFSLSLLLGALGTITWASYNLRGVLVPYPSPADIGFGGHTMLWTVGLFLLYVALQTTLREEAGPFLGLLTATWSLTVVLISLALGSSWAATALPKLALSTFYPFLWALNCALAGSLVLGPKFKQLTGGWRAFVAVVYAGALVLFLTNIAYAVSSAVPADNSTAKYLYHNGGLLDLLFATGNYLLMLGIVLLPLGRPLFQAEQGAPSRAGAQRAAPPPVARTRRRQVAVRRVIRGTAPAGGAARTARAHARDGEGRRQRPDDFVPRAVHPGAQDGETGSAARLANTQLRGRNDSITPIAVDRGDARLHRRATGPCRAGSRGDGIARGGHSITAATPSAARPLCAAARPSAAHPASAARTGSGPAACAPPTPWPRAVRAGRAQRAAPGTHSAPH
jgi:hypothetical protein